MVLSHKEIEIYFYMYAIKKDTQVTKTYKTILT